MSIAVAGMHAFIPNDVLLHIVSFLPNLRSQGIPRINQLFRNFIRQSDTNERRRMEMLSGSLTRNRVMVEWRQIQPDAANRISTALTAHPLIVNSMFNPFTVLLREDVIDARDDFQRIADLAINEQDINRAVVLADINPDEGVRDLTLQDLAIRDGVSLEEALDIADRIQDENVRDLTLYNLAFRDGVSPEEALDIADRIQDGDTRDTVLRAFALRDGVSLEEALDIADRIQGGDTRDLVLDCLAFSAPLEEALDITDRIQDMDARDLTLYNLAFRDGVSPEKALDILNKIQGVRTREEVRQALSRRNAAHQ